MSLLPRSLTGRLILILLAGLLFAQFASLAIHWRDRAELMRDMSGMHFVQRMVGITRLLERTPADQRAVLARNLSSPALRIQISESFTKNANEPTSPLMRMLTRRLQRLLGKDHQVNFYSVTPSAPRGRPGQPPHPMRPMMHRPSFPGQHWPPPMGVSEFSADIELSDGSSVSYHYDASPLGGNHFQNLLLSLAILLGVVILLSLFVVRLATRPLKVLSEGADALGDNLNRPPLPEAGPKEVQAAARALNRLQRTVQNDLREKSNMLAAVSHDLKTPITRLRLRSELLQDPTLSRNINADLDDMEQMINQTLEFMRGMEKHEPDTAVDIDALLDSIVNDLKASGGDISIHNHTGVSCPAQALALKRCFTNLIENAVKYAGKVEISAAMKDGQLVISIEDNGPGIPEDAMEQVFQPFHRLDASRSRDTGGVGMGLAIARNIARSHGGDILLKNRPGGGLTAELKIPCQAST